ncbi:prolyl oligopeptidase family serine peptidase [Roseateles sp.]|uniref:S9 family peptidase n=1 Tax=Roseateles sp. TaxID=1971397 RepID=UPI0037C7F9C8
MQLALIGAAALTTLPALSLAQTTPAATATSTQQASTAPIPLRDFFRSPERAYYRLSTSGQWMSFMQPAVGDGGTAKRMNLFVQAFDGKQLVGEPRQLTRESARDIGGYFWKGDNTLLYVKDFGGDENFHVVAVDVKSGKVTDLTPGDALRAELVNDLRDDPEHILVSHNQRDKRVFDVVRINVKTGAQTVVAQNPGNIVGWQTDHAGKVRMAIASDGVNNTLLYRDKEDEAFKPIITTDFRTSVAPALFDFDNKKFYATSNRGRDKSALVLIDPAKPAAEAEQLVYAHPDVDVAGASYSRLRKVLTTANFVTDKPGEHFFDADTRRLMERLRAKLPGYEVSLQSATDDEQRFIVAASNDRTPGARYVYDRKSDALVKMGDIAPWLPEARMARMQPISYKSRDGLTINGYLTLPAGKEQAKNVACVINPHGGPWARDVWGYNPEIQFLASRGYCVLQMNFRGSTGYGRAFWEASFNQWGLKMQHDITDGVQWLIKQGVADPKRIGIYGASYGGYATLAGITYTPDLYAAAVDYVGVSNLLTFMNSIPPYWKPFLDQLHAMVGHPERDKERLTATSPALNADKIKTPLFIAQGAKDPRVVKSESDQMVEALRKRGVTVQYMVKDNEGHGFANEENRFEFYEAMEKFLAQHLKP